MQFIQFLVLLKSDRAPDQAQLFSLRPGSVGRGILPQRFGGGGLSHKVARLDDWRKGVGLVGS